MSKMQKIEYSEAPKDLYNIPGNVKCWDVRELPQDLSDVLSEATRLGTLLSGQATNFAHMYTKMDLCNVAVEAYAKKMFKGEGKVPEIINKAFELAFWENKFWFDRYDATD